MQTHRATRILLAGSIAALLSVSAIAQSTPNFDGVANFREIGGYQTANGHKIRHNFVYRSAQLADSTSVDREKLARLDIRDEIDLRSPAERQQKPTHWGSNPPKVTLGFTYPSLQPGRQPSASPVAAAQSAQEASARMKSSTAQTPIVQAAEIGQIVRQIAQAEHPVLIHCTGGKDRTGVTVAVLMTLLGVPRSDVYREYLRSNDGLDLRIERGMAFRKANHQPEPNAPDVIRVNSGVDQIWLEAAFEAIDLKYKSFEAYRRDGLKLTVADVDRLRAKLLEK